MRPNNWEHALEASAGIGNLYASDAGEAYLSYWPFGLGLSWDRRPVEGWRDQCTVTPVAAPLTAVQ